MTSDKKIAANQNNAKNSPGPRTELGKGRSKNNAIKHSILARELMVNEMDKPQFEILRRELHDQLSPVTPMQRIAFERILCSLWRHKLAARLDAKQLEVTLAQTDEKKSPPKEVLAENTLPNKWYGASGADLRIGIRLLAKLREDVEANGWIHAEEWKPQVIRAFGENYFSMLTDWVPMKIDAILMAEMLTEKAERFDSPLPEKKLEGDRTVDQRLSWQMGIKLIDLMQEHLESLARIGRLSVDGGGQEHRTPTIELAMRYFTSATRELEHAVAWYLLIKEQGL